MNVPQDALGVLSFTIELDELKQLIGRIYCLGGSSFMTIILPGQQTIESYLAAIGNTVGAASYINKFGCLPMSEWINPTLVRENITLLRDPTILKAYADMVIPQIAHLRCSQGNPTVHLQTNPNLKWNRPDQYTLNVETVPDLNPGDRFYNDFMIDELAPFQRHGGFKTFLEFRDYLDNFIRGEPAQVFNTIQQGVRNFKPFIQELTVRELELITERGIPKNNVILNNPGQEPMEDSDIFDHQIIDDDDFLEDSVIIQRTLEENKLIVELDKALRKSEKLSLDINKGELPISSDGLNKDNVGLVTPHAATINSETNTDVFSVNLATLLEILLKSYPLDNGNLKSDFFEKTIQTDNKMVQDRESLKLEDITANTSKELKGNLSSEVSDENQPDKLIKG